MLLLFLHEEKNMITAIPGKSYLLAFYTFKDMKNINKNVREFVLSTGGIFVSKSNYENIKEDQLELIAKENNISVGKLKAILLLNNCYIVNVLKDIYDTLTKEEQLALLLHEEGHIMLNHIEDLENIEGLHLDLQLEKELEADNYASSIVGKKVLKKALQKYTRKLAAFAALKAHKEKKELIFSTIYDTYTNNNIFKARIANLS